MNRSTALLLIDVQQGLDEAYYGTRNNPGAEQVLARVLAAWRERGWPVFHVQHLSLEPDSPLRPERPGVAIKPEVRPLPGEPLFQKHVNSGFIGTDLEARLRAAGITHLVVGGLTTEHCVSTTVRMAANLGFEVTLLADGTAGFGHTGPDGRAWSAEEIHSATLATLHGEFATVRTAGDVLAAAEQRSA